MIIRYEDWKASRQSRKRIDIKLIMLLIQILKVLMVLARARSGLLCHERKEISETPGSSSYLSRRDFAFYVSYDLWKKDLHCPEPMTVGEKRRM